MLSGAFIGSTDMTFIWLIWAFMTFHDLKITFLRIYGYFRKIFVSECFDFEHQHKIIITVFGHF